eukprot:3008785-Amphidinium_carterae.1
MHDWRQRSRESQQLNIMHRSQRTERSSWADLSVGRGPKRPVDTRVLGHPKEFKGVREDW